MRVRQIVFQILYRIHKPQFRDSRKKHFGQDLASAVRPHYIKDSLTLGEDCFNFGFLNQEHMFNSMPDWNWSGYGKLWTYHLNYFDYLNQKSINKETGLKLIEAFYLSRYTIVDGMEAYPLSLRGNNWIRFFTKHKIHKFDSFLYDQYALLRRSLEYHLLGNHLLENSVSLALGSIYFDQKEWANKASKILKWELKEQILDDGGHFELSPMYHSIILNRLADLYNLIISNPVQAQYFESIQGRLALVLSAMASWLITFQFSNRELAWVNDASITMMPSTVQDLLAYVKSLGIQVSENPLGSSGYRRISTKSYEMLADVGPIGPDYLPGHAHADSLNFVLNWKGKPFIVEAGTSTYEANIFRNIERSTAAHNTVSIFDENSSEVWASFRVGQRARTFIINDTDQELSASHDGYHKYGITHLRTWKYEESTFSIKDDIIGKNPSVHAKLYLHFHYDVIPKLGNNCITTSVISIKFQSKYPCEIKINEYNQAIEFNKVKKAKVVEIDFLGSILTTFMES
jgi:hypothetical protein